MLIGMMTVLRKLYEMVLLLVQAPALDPECPISHKDANNISLNPHRKGLYEAQTPETLNS